MKHRQIIVGTAALLGMLILILDGRTALAGAQEGVELCLKTVIPSLFPFFVLSVFLTGNLAGISFRLLRPIQTLCGLGPGSESVLLSGFLGGYPVGAQAAASLYDSGTVTKKEAERMLAFCSNAGPAFLFGMVASMFPERWMAWSLWIIHMASALMAARFFPGQPQKLSPPERKTVSVSQALNTALHVMAVVCGWVILFRVLICFIKRWILWALPPAFQVAVTGLLELSNGCCELLLVSDVRLRYLICSAMLAFGGLCVVMQTAAVTKGLSLKYYFQGKLLQAAFSLILSALVLSGVWYYGFGLGLLFLLLPQKKQKSSSIQQPVGV